MDQAVMGTPIPVLAVGIETEPLGPCKDENVAVDFPVSGSQLQLPEMPKIQ